jgi:DNA segregation ATPase FtsK/SpoIIIE, S-DNA-T family
VPTNQAPPGDPAPKSGASRPTLMGAGAAGAAGDSRPASILQALERGDAQAAPAASTAPSHLGWKIGAVGLVLAAGLAWSLRPSSPPPAAAPMAKAPAAAGVVPALPAAAPASAAPAAEASAVARIETLPATAAESSPPQAAASAVASPPAIVAKAEPEPDEAAPKAAERKPPRKAEPAAAAPKRTAAAPQAGKPAVDKPQAVAAAAKPATTPARAAPATARRDADVEIVTALMSHIDGRPVAARPAAPAQAQAPVPATLPDPAGPTSMPDNIADLVASCRGGAGTDEALACRWRICKGYWGKAEACPVRDRKAAERAARELQARGDS